MKVSFPPVPGVYIFKDQHGEPLYIGKAKSLRKRIRHYFTAAQQEERIASLIDAHSTIATIQTTNETEAFLLEAQLIQEHQPRFNVLLKTGQPFIYLLFTQGKVSILKLVRNRKQRGTYFGPFINKQQARGVFQFLSKTFRLYHCKQSITNGCLRYHVGICAGTCRPDFDAEQYHVRLSLAQHTLEKDHKKFLALLRKQIALHAEKQEYEIAQRLNRYAEQCDTIFATIRLRYSDHKFAKQRAYVNTTEATPDYTTQASEQLTALLQSTKPIRTIDCFDISHFQSRSMVGSCVRFVDGKPDPSAFRRFKIKTLQQQNDYAALQEIVARRYRYSKNLPDLILIDGGKGQLSSVAHLSHGVPMLALAKKEERIYGLPDGDTCTLDIHTPLGKLLIGLRDYTHHFAVSYHRTRQKIGSHAK